jgi:ABC-type branched-subunit amino acid transport system substrate-binding protein/Flp pilus assembly protein TadD
MNTRSLRTWCSIALGGLLLLPAAFLHGQTVLTHSEDAEQLFREGVARYQEGKDAAALAAFDRLLLEYPSAHRVTGALVMKGKTLYRMGENLEAVRTLRTLLATYPTTSYAPDAHLILGLVNERIGRYQEAIDEILGAWHLLPASPPPRLVGALATSLDTLIDAHLTSASVRARIPRAVHAEERAFLWLKLAEREEAAGSVVGAREALDSLAAVYPGYRQGDRIAAMRSRVSVKTNVRIGALVPLMTSAPPSALKEVGAEVWEGIQFAAEEAAADPAQIVRIAVDMRDTERDGKVAGLRARELCLDLSVIGIIGPVFSFTAIAAAETSRAHGMPIVTPTATSNGIAAIGPTVFQANADFETRGTAMARYAVQVRGIRRFGILSPDDVRGRSLADAFSREVHRLGGQVLVTEWYPRGTSDLKSQLRSIRRASMLADADPLISFSGRLKSRDLLTLVDLGIPPRRLDSLMSRGHTVSARLLLGPDARTRLDSVRFPYVFNESRIDSIEYPAAAVEGLYAPIAGPEEIGVVSSQVVYFHLETQLFGSAEWNSIEQLDANKRYCTGVSFDADVQVDSGSTTYATFRAAFQARFRKNPGRNTVYGYDAARLVFSLVRAGALTREGLRQALAEVRDFQGLRSHLGLFPRRVNSWLPILQFNGDIVGRVDEINVAGP